MQMAEARRLFEWFINEILLWARSKPVTYDTLGVRISPGALATAKEPRLGEPWGGKKSPSPSMMFIEKYSSSYYGRLGLLFGG